MIGHIVWINRRSGVVHYHSSCPSLSETWPGMLRKEQFDPSRPRRCCSMCWADTAAPVGKPVPRVLSALQGRAAWMVNPDRQGQREAKALPGRVIHW